MKSVSFSDLRDSHKMSNMDSSMKRSSSNKQLTYYSSSEDILRRFSSKKPEKFSYKEKPTEDSINELPMSSESITQSMEEPIIRHEKVTLDISIKELRDQLTQKNNIIANLQDENLILQTESKKNGEQVKFLENRIKYLEHALASFATNTQEKVTQIGSRNDASDKENDKTVNFQQYPIKSKSFSSKINSDTESPDDETKNSSYFPNKSRFGTENASNQEKITDLKKRPSSADSTLQNNLTSTGNKYDEDLYNQTRQSSSKPYDSDSEQNKPYKNSSAGYKQMPKSYIEFQRQKLERDRSMNLTEFKSRLDDFTKYARQSLEQNCLRSSTSSLGQSNDYKSVSKYNSTSETYSDTNNRNRTKASYQYSRPPIDPYHKQRRTNAYETKVSNESLTNHSSLSQNSIDEDTHLKERVKKILEKHNYPAGNNYSTSYSHDRINGHETDNTGYRDEFTNFATHKQTGNRENSRLTDWRHSNSPTQYGFTVNGKPKYNDSSIPRLDLSLNNPAINCPGDTSDLLEKYLNYQGYANVM